MKKNLLNNCVNVFFIPLILITIIGSFNNLYQQVTSATKSTIIFFDICFLALCVLCFSWHKFMKNSEKLNNRLIKRSILALMVILILLWQLYLVFNLSGVSDWDPTTILNAVTNGTDKTVTKYFSQVPNNFFLYLVERFVWNILGHPSIKTLTISLNIINYILIDCSLIALYSFANQILKGKNAVFILSLGIILLGLSPWGCIPYSDVYAFTLTTFSVIYLTKYFRSKDRKNQYLYSIICGIFLLLYYLIKPSTIVSFIAFFIIMLFLADFQYLRKHILSIGIMIIIPIIMIMGFSVYQKNNSLVKINANESFPMMHFADMGVYGNGGYWGVDSIRDEKIKTLKKRKEVDKKVWIKRVRSRGFTGYQKFLIQKQMLNTSDGSFSWGQEGTYFLKPFNSHNSIAKRLFINRRVPGYAFNGKVPAYANIIACVIQTIWISMLLLSLLTLNNTSFISVFSKLSFIGFCMFLLLFEGGRSRYVLQFLPFILILAGLGMQKIQSNFNFMQVNKANKSVNDKSSVY